MRTLTSLMLMTLTLLFNGCGTESHRTIDDAPIVKLDTSYNGPKSQLVVGKFSNKSPYLNGIFSDGSDKLGNQGKEILKANLVNTRRFDLLDRDNLELAKKEAKHSGNELKTTGANQVLTGAVTDFGRKVVGSNVLFGLFGKSRTQVAYASVKLNIVDVTTSKFLFSVTGTAEYDLNTKEVLGTGSRMGYDSTLNGKVLNLAIVDAINKLIDGADKGLWKLEQ